MKVKGDILFYFILICLIIGIILIPGDSIYNYLKPLLSPDGIIKPESVIRFQQMLLYAKIFFVVFMVSLMTYWKFNVLINSFLNKILNSIERYTGGIQISFNYLFYPLLGLSVLLMIYAMYSFDIGLDESFYLNDIQNITKYGLPTRMDNYNEISCLVFNLPFNLVSLLIVKIFGFNLYYIRAIVLLTSVGVGFLINSLIDQKERKMVALLLIIAFPGINYLTSCAYIEMIGLFFVLAAIRILRESNSSPLSSIRLNLSALMMVLAILSKFQIILWFILVIFFLFFFFSEKFFYFKYALRVLIIYFLITLLGIWFSGVDNYFKILYGIILGNTHGAVSFNMVGLINKTFWLSEMLFIPVLFLIWYETAKGIRSAPLFQKLIFAFSIVCIFHWWFSNATTTWRNAFIGIATTLILFALRYPFSLKSKPFKAAVISYVIIGIIMNYAFIRNGSVDDIQYYRNHILKESFTYNSPNYQKEFFKEVKKNLHSDDMVYALGQIFIPKLYLDNRPILSFEKLKDPSDLPVNSYVIITYGMMMEGISKTDHYKWLISNCSEIHRNGEYYLYQRKK
jgi:hypothetical protein